MVQFEIEYRAECRFYVYDQNGMIASDWFSLEDDAIEFAKNNNYPIVKLHRYFYDEFHKMHSNGCPEVIWSNYKEVSL